ncbi:MAG TPA: MFS transporter [Candidatus Acidoferrum sp.]|nr:MFS transporter [Candidatus Acidoferrum sp.]
MTANQSGKIFYGWWVVAAAFLNFFFIVGIIFYGFPVFYSSFVESLGFTRSQVTQGFFLGFLIVGLPFGLVAGAMIDRIGAKWVIVAGTAFVGVSLLLMARMTKLWQYEALCVLEVLGYVFAGPIATQVLVARWFRVRRGRAMGIAYLGLGSGGVVAPLLVNYLIRTCGWRHALEIVALALMGVLFPMGIWIIKSTPEESGLQPDGEAARGDSGDAFVATGSLGVAEAVRTTNFWLILFGSTLAIGAIGAVIQHFILFLKDQGYSSAVAARFSTGLLLASLAGRILVGYAVDHVSKKNAMALFYFLIGASVLLLGVAKIPTVVWVFAAIFGFSMGADYMLVSLVAAECFGTRALGKLLALIIMGYSLGQWGFPWIAGKIFDARHSYDLAWKGVAVAAMIGGLAIYAISQRREKTTA